MKMYLYKHNSDTFLCIDLTTEEAIESNISVDRIPKIGNHNTTAIIVNGDEFEDGEEINDDDYRIESSPIVDRLLSDNGIAPPVLLRRVR
jgi:hypothetical protein